MPDLSDLQRVTREAKAVSASTQATLSDPAALAQLQDARALRDEALSKGLHDVAAKVQDIIDNLEAREKILRDAQEASDVAQRAAVQTIINIRQQFGDPDGASTSDA
jgi:hypothetical protein